MAKKLHLPHSNCHYMRQWKFEIRDFIFMDGLLPQVNKFHLPDLRLQHMALPSDQPFKYCLGLTLLNFDWLMRSGVFNAWSLLYFKKIIIIKLKKYENLKYF